MPSCDIRIWFTTHPAYSQVAPEPLIVVITVLPGNCRRRKAVRFFSTATRNLIDAGEDRHEFAETIQVRSFSKQRMAQLRSAVLVALTRGVISFNDRICCIGGITGSNQFDTLVVVDVERPLKLENAVDNAELAAGSVTVP